MKKKGIIVLTSILIIIISIVCIYKVSNKKETGGEVTPPIVKKDLKIVKKITLDKKEYGKYNYSMDNLLYFNIDGKKIILDDKLNKLITLNNKDSFALYDSKNNNIYYQNNQNLYDKDNNIIYTVDEQYYISEIYNNMVIMDQGVRSKYSIYDLNTKETKVFDQYEGIFGDIILTKNSDNYYIYDGKWTEYKNYKEIYSNREIISLWNNENDKIYLDKNKGKIEYQDSQKEKINSYLYLDNNDECRKVRKIDTNETISDECIYSYRVSSKNENIVEFIVTNNPNSRILINGEIKKYESNYWTHGEGNYYIEVEKDTNGNEINTKIIDSSGNEINNTCVGTIKYIKDDTYLCDEIIFDSLSENINDIKEISNDITCNKNGYCSVTKDGTYALYSGNEKLTDNIYVDIKILDNLIILENLDNYDVLFLDIDGEEIDKKGFEPTEKNYEIDTDEIINKYQLDKDKNIIEQNIDLFKKYSYIVENNNKLGEYKNLMYDYFKVVVDNKKYLNETIFFNKLSTLEFQIVNKLETDGAAAEYHPDVNKIITLPFYEKNKKVLYHEIMHFIDWCLNSNESSDYYSYENGFFNKEQYIKSSLDEKKLMNDTTNTKYKEQLRAIIEGGAEANSGKYFFEDATNTYDSPVGIYRTLSYIYGDDKINDVFYGNTSMLELVFNDIDSKSYEKFYDSVRKITLINVENTSKDNAIVIDTLINLYKAHNENWLEDKKFQLLIYNLIWTFDNKTINESNYSKELNKIKTNYSEIQNSIYNKYINNDKIRIFMTVPKVIIKDDRVYIFYPGSINEKQAGSTYPIKRNVVFKTEYDLNLNEHKMICYIDEQTGEIGEIN